MSSPVASIHRQTDQQSEQLRAIAALSLAGLVDFIPISLYQLGIIKHLPDPPGKIFHSDKVNGSDDAQILGIPDGPISLALYGASIALAAAALANRGTKFYRVALAGIALGQAAGGAYYLYNMAKVQKKVCPYCVAGAVINFAILAPLKKLFLNGAKKRTGS